MAHGSACSACRASRAAVALLALVLMVADVPRGETDPPSSAEMPVPFAVWLDGVHEEARQRGISPEIVREALDGVEPVARVLEIDRRQPEVSLDLDAYLQRRVTPYAIRMARQQLAAHRGLLARIEHAYGVQPRFVVAIWGLESSFGHFSGARPVIPTLATLAYDPRRSPFFREELLAALEILDRGDVTLADMHGSWAGAMGQPQFMPTSYLAYAEDFDNDGRKDIWKTSADVFASIASYLKSHGWVPDYTWGRRVQVPASVRAAEAVPLRDEGCRAERRMSAPRPLSEWDALGVRRAEGSRLPEADLSASLVEIDDHGSYLVYANYEALLRYNCAHAYALSVALLADRAVGR